MSFSCGLSHERCLIQSACRSRAAVSHWGHSAAYYLDAPIHGIPFDVPSVLGAGDRMFRNNPSRCPVEN